MPVREATNARADERNVRHPVFRRRRHRRALGEAFWFEVWANTYSKQYFKRYPSKGLRNEVAKSGNMYDLDSRDTTVASAWRAGFGYDLLFPNERLESRSGYYSIEDMSPYDTVRIFVFDGQNHYLLSSKKNRDEYFESEKYLCRYDLTAEDLYDLLDKDGKIVVSYPPSNAMSIVKMFPSYGELTGTR